MKILFSFLLSFSLFPLALGQNHLILLGTEGILEGRRPALYTLAYERMLNAHHSLQLRGRLQPRQIIITTIPEISEVPSTNNRYQGFGLSLHYRYYGREQRIRLFSGFFIGAERWNLFQIGDFQRLLPGQMDQFRTIRYTLRTDWRNLLVGAELGLRFRLTPRLILDLGLTPGWKGIWAGTIFIDLLDNRGAMDPYEDISGLPLPYRRRETMGSFYADSGIPLFLRQNSTLFPGFLGWRSYFLLRPQVSLGYSF